MDRWRAGLVDTGEADDDGEEEEEEEEKFQGLSWSPFTPTVGVWTKP